MNRAWMTFGDDLNILQFKMSHATDQAAFESFRDEINGKLARLESVHSGERFFNGEDFCLIDAAYAPFFMRLSLMKNLCSIDFLDGFPKMQAWSKALLSQDCVIDSVVPELPSMYQNMIRNVENGYLANMA
jgi:glutathione S-transferase